MFSLFRFGCFVWFKGWMRLEEGVPRVGHHRTERAGLSDWLRISWSIFTPQIIPDWDVCCNPCSGLDLVMRCEWDTVPVFKKLMAGCYEVNCVPIQNSYVEILNPSVFRDRIFILFYFLEIGLLKNNEVKMKPSRWALIHYDWCPYKKRTLAHRKKAMWTHAEEKKAIYKPDGGLRSKQACQHLDCGLPVSDTMRQSISVV